MNEEQKIEMIRTEIAEHLQEIADFFDKPDDVKVTCVVRCPWLGDGNLVVSNDDYDRAALTILDLKNRPPKATSTPDVMRMEAKIIVACPHCKERQTITIGRDGSIPECVVCDKKLYELDGVSP